MKEIRDYREVHEELVAATDPGVMHQDYGMDDNVTLLIDAVDPQMFVVEEMLEREYPKHNGVHYFFMNLARFQVRYYIYGALGIFKFSMGDAGMLSEDFRKLAKQKFETKSHISFHGDSPDDTFDSQVVVIRDSVIDVANKLMRMKVRFALNDCPAIFEPEE